MTMYFLIYAAIGTAKKKKRRKQSDNVLVELCHHRYCTERKKGRHERDNVLAILCGHRESVQKEKKGDTNVTMSWLYYAATENLV